MKKVSIIAAVIAVTVGLAGCSCHRASAYSTQTAPAADNSSYQSDTGSKFGKLGHAKKHHRHHHHNCAKPKCAKHKCDKAKKPAANAAKTTSDTDATPATN